jgi:hypothetical protein
MNATVNKNLFIEKCNKYGSLHQNAETMGFVTICLEKIMTCIYFLLKEIGSSPAGSSKKMQRPG